MYDGLFGFDFDGDGEVSIFDDAMAMMIMDDMDEEDRLERKRRERCFDTDILNDKEQNEDDGLFW